MNLTRNNKLISVFSYLYVGVNLLLSSAQYFFHLFPDGWIPGIMAVDIIVPASIYIFFLLFLRGR
jgi:hypothetical protein